MIITQPIPEHAPPWSKNYLKYIEEEESLLQSMQGQREVFLTFLKSIPADKWDHRYEEGKWSIKGVVSHVIDTELIFQYRSLRASRYDATNMEGFDENAYDLTANLDERSPEQIINQFAATRNSSIALFEGMNESNLDFIGMGNNQPFSARSGGWLMVGHAIHHMHVIEERYLIGTD